MLELIYNPITEDSEWTEVDSDDFENDVQELLDRAEESYDPRISILLQDANPDLERIAEILEESK